MNALEFTASIIRSLAWPLIVFFGILLFQKQIAERIGAISKVSVKKGEIDFDSALRETKLDVQASVEAEQIPKVLQKSIVSKTDISENVGKIVAAWRELEEILQHRLSAGGIDKPPSGGKAMIEKAREAELITDDQTRSLLGLNALRNLAVHGRDDEIDQQRTDEFLMLADTMKTVLNITQR